MKALAIAAAAFLCSAAPAKDDASVYLELHGQRVDPLYEKSCGAAKRLLSDHYRMIIDGGFAAVNYTEWRVEGTTPESAVLSHASEPDSITRLLMIVEWDPKDWKRARATLLLTGITEQREPCADQVILVGASGSP